MKIRIRRLVLAASVLLIAAAWINSTPAPAAAQPSSAMKDDIEQLAVDLHVGMDRSSLTEQQKQQMREDLRQLREARQNHTPLKGFEAARSLRSMLDSGAFKPEDKERIKQDLKAIREARGNGGMMEGGPMGGGNRPGF